MRKITLLCTLMFTLSTAFAQTTLGAGDIAFVGLNTDGATDAEDNFAFILLKDIDAATQIIFTDRGWSDATGFSSYAGDGEFTWTSGAARTAGDVIVLDFSNLSPPAASFTVLGDQLFAIQGSIASPTFIAGLHFNVVTGVTDDANWDGDATSNTTSALPYALTTGDTAVRLTGPGGIEQDNFQFSCSIAGCPLSGTPQEIRGIVHNLTNWISDNDTVYPGTVDANFGTTTVQSPNTIVLLITEIMYNPNSPEDDWEWIEIYNPGTTDLDISGYVVDDVNGTAHTGANIASGIVPAEESAVLYNSDDVSEADFLAAWGDVNLIPVTNWGAMALNNGGDTIGIWNSFASYSGDNVTQSNVIEQVTYEIAGWPVDNGTSSVYLTDLNADNTVGSNWALSADGGASPLFEGYSSKAAGGNTGADIGSPGIPVSPICEVIINTQPLSKIIYEGNSLNFDVGASGNGTISYQWQVDTGSGFVDLGVPSANSQLNFAYMEIGGNGNQYRVVVTSDNDTPEDDTDNCSITSDVATLTVKPLTNITILKEVVGTGADSDQQFHFFYNTSISEEYGNFYLSESGIGIPNVEGGIFAFKGSFGFQVREIDMVDNYLLSDIQFNSENGNSTLNFKDDDEILINVSEGDHVTITFTNEYAEECLVSINEHPQDKTICAGNPLSFDAVATGNGMLSYQWQVDSGSGFVDLGAPGANSALNFAYMEAGGDGNLYRIVVTGDNGTPEDLTDDCIVISEVASLTVEVAPEVIITGSGSYCWDGEGVILDAGAGYASYVWSPGGETTQTITATNGTYSVTVTSEAGCEATSETFTVIKNEAMSCSITQDVLASNHESEDGVATVYVDGGDGNYTYLWDNGEITQTATTLTYGMHTVTVTDQTGCETTCQIDIAKELYCWTNLLQNVSYNGGSDGSARVRGNGGYRPYTFQWEDGSTGEVNDHLTAGTHYVTITDANGATSQCSVTISEPNEGNCTNLTCSIEQDVLATNHETPDGVATVYPVGGSGEYSYLWDNGETGQTATTLTYGIHTVTVTDETGCEATCQIDVAKELYCWTNLLQNVSYNGGSDGSARVRGNGGYRPYTFQWEDGSTGEVNDHLTAGTHYVTITDANGATSQCSVTISEPNEGNCTDLTCSIEQDVLATNHQTPDGVATVYPVGGSGQYTYLWDNGETGQTATTLTYGIHTVTVTDETGCETTCQIDIAKELYCWTNLLQNVSYNGGSDGSARVRGNGGYRPYTFQWEDGSIGEVNDHLTAGTHYVTITDANGATSQCSVTISEPIEEVCDGLDNDGDGFIDEGFDQDGDGIADCFDICPAGDDTLDSDGDGIPDNCDQEECDGLDNDGDGSIDEGFDQDGDGTADCFDQCDDNIDSDLDGVPDCKDICPGGDDTVDTDGDGTPDFCDQCDDRDNDGDGVPNCEDVCPNGDDSLDEDGDGIPDACDDDECIKSEMPQMACYETAIWNPDNCRWDIVGEQPEMPVTECYQTTTWNPDTCSWDVEGEQPLEPETECYQTATWNPDTCEWELEGEQPEMPETLCYETAIWNMNTCEWDIVQDGDPSCAGGSIDKCETAFARSSDSSTCFDDIPNFNSPRWGWTNEFPSIDGTYQMDLYAAAGQCDISKGALVGNVEVVFNNGSVDVTVSTLSGYKMTVAQLHVGTDPIPTNPNNGNLTVAPGQYAYKYEPGSDFTNYTFEDIGTGDSDTFYVILHANVCPMDEVAKRQTVSVELKGYPIPFKEDITIEVTSPGDTKGVLYMYGGLGQKVRNFGSHKLRKGKNEIALSVGDLSPGMYFIHCTSGYGTQILKVLNK